VENLGPRLKLAKEIGSMEFDPFLTSETLAAGMIAEALLASGASSSLAQSTPSKSQLKELRPTYDSI